MYGLREVKTRDGRLVLIGKPQRVAQVNRNWGYFNQVRLTWIDEQGNELSTELVSLGKFNKEQKPIATGFRRHHDAGSKTFVRFS